MKFVGKIGFWFQDVEVKPDVYDSLIVEKDYIGDVKRVVEKFRYDSNQQNPNLVTSNRISIISDMYLEENWPSIKYVYWKGIYWEVNSTDVTNYPRVVLDLGGVYNGRKAEPK